MGAETEGQDAGLGPPGTSALLLISEGLRAALERLETAGVILIHDAGDLPTTVVQQAALEERTEAVPAELRRLHGEVRRDADPAAPHPCHRPAHHRSGRPLSDAGMNLPASTAPQPAAHLRASVHQFVATTSAPALARQATAGLLEGWGLADLTDTTVLLISELVTNAVRATESAGDSPDSIGSMRISWAARSLIIEVWDPNPKPPELQVQYLDDEGGRGLHIVEALSIAAAYYPSPTGVGKVIWCQIEAPAPPEAEEPSPLLPHRRPTVARADPGLVFDDMAVLKRVLDGLRALDGCLPRSNAMRY